MNNRKRALISALLTFVLIAPGIVIPDAEASTKRKKAPAKTATQNRGSGKNRSLDFKRSRLSLPQSSALKAPPVNPRNMGTVKPPRSSDFYEGGGKEAEYERLVDEEITSLYKLSQQYRRSRSRGEIWLRLAERYVEKAQLVEFREQSEYDKRLKAYNEKKTTRRPTLNTRVAKEYHVKAIQLYEWFLKDFPTDKKVDQALFFLGYNQFEMGDTKKGEQYYIELTKRFPKSSYVTESHFALGEFYFENEKWSEAAAQYAKVIRQRRARLYAFALYKSSWCLFRLGKTGTALKMLERVVRHSRAGEASENVDGRKAVNKIRLASEALRDYVPFYAESGDYNNALREFERVSGDDKEALKMLERLAYTYADSGNRSAAQHLFKQLIASNPTGEKAADYQYQVVLAFTTADQKVFRQELYEWISTFGPESFWAKENRKNEKLIADTYKLQETTLRNHVLQLHQTAQNSRAQYSQRSALAAYQLYTKFFADSPQFLEMQFFHAELLFDMERHQDAAKLYLWVAEKDQKGQFREKALVNALLALENDLPSAQTIETKRGDTLDKIPFEPEVARFEQAATKYVAGYPKGDKVSDIQRRLGVLYYSYNHFDEAIAVFEKLIRADPKSENAAIAGNLILDIYKLKDDMVGLASKGEELLAVPGLASTKFGIEVKSMMERASYARADKLASTGGDPIKSAQEFEKFAGSYKKSDLAMAARYKAAENYEKGGDLVSSVRMHNMVLAVPTKDPKMVLIQNDSRNSVARLYQQMGQLEQAARQYESYAKANSKDQKAVNAFYNAALLWDGLNEYNSALQNYDAYMNFSRKSDRNESLYLQAEIWRKRGNYTRAVPLYDKYITTSGRDAKAVVHSHYVIAVSHERAGRVTRAKEWYQKTIDVYRRLKSRGGEGAVKYAAEARFKLAQDTMNQLRQIRFTSSDKQQAQAATQIKTLREKYINEMKDVIRFDHGPYIVAALAASGQCFDYLAQTFGRIPVPAGFSAEDGQKYKELIQVQVNEMKKEAQTAYKAALDKAWELETYNEWSLVALNGMNQFDPATYPLTGEQAAESRAADWMGL